MLRIIAPILNGLDEEGDAGPICFWRIIPVESQTSLPLSARSCRRLHLRFSPRNLPPFSTMSPFHPPPLPRSLAPSHTITRSPLSISAHYPSFPNFLTCHFLQPTPRSPLCICELSLSVALPPYRQTLHSIHLCLSPAPPTPLIHLSCPVIRIL